MAGLRITTMAPQTGAQLPSDAELLRLLEIVRRAHPGLIKNDGPEAFGLEDFRVGFWGQGLLFRRHAPRQDRRFGSFIEHFSDLYGVSLFGPAFLCACLASAEIPIQLQDLSAGRLLEIGADEYSGITSRNSWRRILAGEATLLTPIARKMPGQAPDDLPSFRAYRMG